MSHATVEYPYAGAVKVREPVARPLDVVAVELLLSASQAFLVGVLMYLAVGVWADRGVGGGSVAIVLGLLGLAVGGSWLYWLLGGVGWPLAVADVPVAMFLGFALVLGWFGEDLFHIQGVPLLLGVAAAVYGIVCGVFLNSPRRWRWDQRQRLRAGTRVPRISGTTQALVAQVPRSLPRRVITPEPVSELAARIEQSTPPTPAPSAEVSATSVPGQPAGLAEAPQHGVSTSEAAPSPGPVDPELTDAPRVEGTPLKVPEAPEPKMPTARYERGPSKGGSVSSSGAVEGEEGDGIVLPTMIEPKAQRSPWAWAAPPEWNREEDDEVAGGRSSKGS